MSIKKLLGLFLVVGLVAVTGVFANGQKESPSTTTISDAENVTAPGTFPVVKNPITLKVLMRGSALIENWDTNAYTMWLEKKTGVHIAWTIADENNYQQKMNLVLASGDLPDVLLNMDISPTQQVIYGDQGIFVPLNSLIDKYTPTVQKIMTDLPAVKQTLVGPGGKIYSLPYVNECYHCSMDWKMYLYTPWLKKLGLSVPKTPAEFEKMLFAFKNDDPNGNGKHDEIALVGSTDARSDVSVFLMNSFIYDNPMQHQMFVKDGKIDVAYDKPAWKDGLTYIHRLYSEGLIAPQSWTQTRDQAKALAEGQPPIMGAYPSHSPSSFTIIDGPLNRWLEYVPISPLKGPQGVQFTAWMPYQAYFSIGEFAMTKADKNPAATMRWADAQYSLEANLWSNFGQQGKDWAWPKPTDKGRDGNPATYELLVPFGQVNNDNWAQRGLDFRTDDNWYRGQAITESAESQRGLPNKEKVYYDETKEFYTPYKPPLDTIVPPLFFTQDQASQLADMETSITTYVASMTAKFITGDANLTSDWDTYLKTLNNMNLKRYIQIYQQAYDTAHGK
ncbi:MAG TPA: extracellular solute-binding protein [Spirochaetia bacterium]|nr:extracellular solute-binding protein [Spirochaetia bacterium]